MSDEQEPEQDERPRTIDIVLTIVAIISVLLLAQIAGITWQDLRYQKANKADAIAHVRHQQWFDGKKSTDLIQVYVDDRWWTVLEMSTTCHEYINEFKVKDTTYYERKE